MLITRYDIIIRAEYKLGKKSTNEIYFVNVDEGGHNEFLFNHAPIGEYVEIA